MGSKFLCSFCLAKHFFVHLSIFVFIYLNETFYSCIQILSPFQSFPYCLLDPTIVQQGTTKQERPFPLCSLFLLPHSAHPALALC